MSSSSHLYNKRFNPGELRNMYLVLFLLVGFECDFVSETEHIDGFGAVDEITRRNFLEESIISIVVTVPPSAFFLWLKDVGLDVIRR